MKEKTLIWDYLTFFDNFYTISIYCQMDHGENKEETLDQARITHSILDRRLRMLLRKPYLTACEEVEMKVLKKKKLYYKDMMCTMAETTGQGKEKA